MLIVPISLSKHFQPSNIAALQIMVTAAGILPRRPQVTWSPGIEVQLGGMGQQHYYREQAVFSQWWPQGWLIVENVQQHLLSHQDHAIWHFWTGLNQVIKKI